MRRRFLVSEMVKSTDSRGLSKVVLFNVGKEEGSGPFRMPWKYSLNVSTTWVGESAAEPSGSLRARGMGWTVFAGACTCIGILGYRERVVRCAAGTGPYICVSRTGICCELF